jgi:AcrR family transcriptional regulator
MRDVAARACVDPALLYHYFGSKQRLFVAAMQLPYDWRALVASLSDLSPEEAGEHLVRYMLGLWESPGTRPLMLGLVRSMTTDPTAASMVREMLVEGPVAAMASASGSPDMALRVQLAAAQVMGLALVRFVVGVEPVASARTEDLVRAVAPTIARYLAGTPT